MNLREFTEAFAVPGEDSIIDLRHPETGRSVICNETLEQIRARYPAAAIVTVADWIAGKAARQHTPIEWHECSGARFDEMLNVLPPAAMERGGFLVGEPWDHDAETGQPRFAAFRQTSTGYLESTRPMTRSEFRRALA